MAVALAMAVDAHMLWTTLSLVAGTWAMWVAFTVAALVVAPVTGIAHAARLARRRVSGFGGSIAWIGVIVTVWASAGAVGTWLSTITTTSLPAAGALWLVLFMLSGTLVATNAYRFGDPRAPAIRRALRRRAQREADLVEAIHQVELAAATLDAYLAERDRFRAWRERASELDEARRTQLNQYARLCMAAVMGDPAATDALVPKDLQPLR